MDVYSLVMKIRSLSVLVLALMLAVTSVTMAVGRSSAPMGPAVVICADGGAVMMTLDAMGRPVPITHPCPDCVAAVAAQVLAGFDPAPQRPDFPSRALRPAPITTTAVWAEFVPQARGPPDLI